MKESIKRTTDWAAYYHTSRRSWYPKPEETVSLSQAIAPLPAVEISQADRLRPYAKLGVLLWSCGEATYSTTRMN